MISNRHYPRNYFDPYDTPLAQCCECADWFEAGEIEDVHEVTCLEQGSIYQGICIFCKSKED